MSEPLRDDDTRIWVGDPIPARTELEAAIDDSIARSLRMDRELVEHVTDELLACWDLTPKAPVPIDKEPGEVAARDVLDLWNQYQSAGGWETLQRLIEAVAKLSTVTPPAPTNEGNESARHHDSG